AEDGIRDRNVTGVQTCALPISFMSTLAGSGTMLVHLAKRGETVAIDFNGQAPARADATMFRLIDGISDGLFAWPRVEHAANEYEIGRASWRERGGVAGGAGGVR